MNVIIAILILVIIIFIYVFLIHRNQKNLNIESMANNITKEITKATDNWINTVIGDQDWTSEERAKKIANLFSEDGMLLGTVSHIRRTQKSNPSIEDYFKFFNVKNNPELRVNQKKFFINQIDKNTFINNAFVEWQLSNDLSVTAKMTFIFRKDKNNYKIFLLNSSPIFYPEPPEMLQEQGDKFKLWNLNDNSYLNYLESESS